VRRTRVQLIAFLLEPSHLAGRGGHPIEVLTVHDGAHDEIVRQALGIVHVLIASKTAEHRLAKKSHQEMSGVLAAPRLRQKLSAQLGQSKRVIELAVGKKTTIG
jgi:hypothetical protein